MNNKKLDTNPIVNELKGSSLFFAEGKESTVSETPPTNAFSPAVVPLPPSPDVQTDSAAPSQVPGLPDPLYDGTASMELDSAEIPPSQNAQVIPESDTPSTAPARETNTRRLPSGNSMVGADERLTERTNERRKVRHSFDILSGQLFMLREIAIERERLVGRKTLLGDLVQEALDLFIAQERRQD